ncbi:hypothetical protein [uncultured Treponema sp.]|uniref:hypothetical protein n=1 Tax=uncultured Treponema sp. TaxID=162155 RepID=UPI002803CFA6|nr:hypothetical protein [uncultured Treponema sp.]
MIGNVFLGKRDCDPLELGYVLSRKFWKKTTLLKPALLCVKTHFQAARTEPKRTANRWTTKKNCNFHLKNT